MASLMRGIDAEKYDRAYSDRDLVLRILNYFRPHRRKVVVVAICITLMAALGAVVPIVIANSLNAGAAGARFPTLLVALVLVAGVGTWALTAVRRYLTAQVVADVVNAMRNDVFAAAMRQDMSFFDEYSSGRIVSRITSDTQEFGEVLNIAIDVINQLATAGILVIVLFGINWRLALAVVAMTPLVVLVALLFRRMARDVTRQSSRALAEVNKAIQEAVSGIRVAKNFRQEQAIYDEFMQVNDQAYSINVRRAFVLANIFPTLNALAGVGTAVLVYFGGRSAIAGIISIGSWYIFVTTVDRFWFPVTNLSAFWSQFQACLLYTSSASSRPNTSAAIIATLMGPGGLALRPWPRISAATTQ